MDSKRYLACVSSNDSVSEQVRRDIQETLAGMQTIATGLSFPALTEGYQWKLQQLALNDADFCIFIVGRDYGPLSETGVGYMHRAFASARITRKPILVLQSDALSPELDAVDQRRLGDMLAEMEQHATVIKVLRLQDIRGIVENYVDDLLESEVLKGWRRIQQWDPDAVRHRELMEQVEVLRMQLDSQRLTTEQQTPEPVVPTLDYRIKVFRNGNVAPHDYSLALGWPEIFKTVAPLLTQPQRETDWKNLFEERLLREALPDLRTKHPQAHGFVELKLDSLLFDQIKHYFRQRGWLLHSQGIWQLSALGEDYWLRG